MKAYDVWFYAVTVEAESETEAIAKVNGALDRALLSAKTLGDQAIIENIQVDYAELIGDEEDL